MHEHFSAGLISVDLISGKLASGLKIKFDDHGTLVGYITWKSKRQSSTLPINLNKDFDQNICHILEVLLGKENFSSAAYDSNANLNDLLIPGLEATAIFVNGIFKGFSNNERYAIINFDHIIESREALILDLLYE